MPSSTERDAAFVEFVEFVDARRARLVRTAYLLCGDWHTAEDLVQAAVVKLYLAWPRLLRRGGEEAYLRRILVNSHLDDRSLAWRRSESTVPELDERARVQPPPSDSREELRQALAALPTGQRQVVVLRHWLGQSVEETAEDLGISTGTVKSQTARGLAALRASLANDGTTRQATVTSGGAA